MKATNISDIDVYVPLLPDGADHLVNSKTIQNAVRGAAFDANNNLIGQANWIKVDLSKLKESLTKKGIGIGSGLTIIAVGIGFAAYKGYKYLNHKRTKKAELNSEICHLSAVASSLPTLATTLPIQIETVVNEYELNLTSEEAQKHLCAIMVAAAFIANEIRMISKANIVSDTVTKQFSLGFEKLMTNKITDGINTMLQNNVSLLDKGKEAVFFEFFSGGYVAEDGKYIPIQNEKVREALRIDLP